MSAVASTAIRVAPCGVVSISGARWARVAKLDLMVGPEPSVPRKFRVAFTSRRAARDSLQRIFAWPTEKVLMAHGTPVEKDAQAFLRRASKGGPIKCRCLEL